MPFSQFSVAKPVSGFNVVPDRCIIAEHLSDVTGNHTDETHATETE